MLTSFTFNVVPTIRSKCSHLKAQVKFPELDIRQRLTVSRGYDVADLVIPEGAELVGQAIGASGLSAKDINVLSLHRNGKVIPNPMPSRIIEAGDRLLCFEKVATMNHLIPEKSRKRREPVPAVLPPNELPGPSSEQSLVPEDAAPDS